jgi:hypothetical protein
MPNQATVWNPDTGDKQVINVGGAMPQGYSLWTGGNASGQAARAAIMNAQKPVAPTGDTPAVPGSTLPAKLAPNNTVDSSTLNLGLNSGGITSSLPTSSETAASIYANGAVDTANTNLANLQKQQDIFNANRLKETQDNLSNLQNQENAQISDYDTQMAPIQNEATSIYKSELDAISKTNFNDLITQKQNLTKQITDYATMMNNELSSQNSAPSLESVATGRSNAIISNYTSRIAISKSALDAIDGNFTLANDTISQGAAAIQRILDNRDAFIKTVKSLYDTPIANLTADEKTLLDQASKDIQTQKDNIQKNKDVINGLMTTNPVIANKAGLSLTDTPDQTAQKLSAFYIKNPQYTPDNQAYIKTIMDKYPDAGITMNDPLATVQAKLTTSPIYQIQNKPIIIGKDPNNSNDIYGTFNPDTGTYSPIDTSALGQLNASGKVATSTGETYDLFNISGQPGKYATNPDHVKSVQSILNSIGQMSSISDMDKYIQSVAPGSPITGQMIANAAGKYGVSWEIMMAAMQQDSSFGTKGLAAKTFNPGNVGNTDNGSTVNMKTWQAGVNAVAQNMSERFVGTQTGVNQTANGGKDYNQYGLLSKVDDFNPTNPVDKSAVSYLNYYLKNAAFPTYYTLFGRSAGGNLANTASRAQDLFYKATGQSLPDVNVLKGNKNLIINNNRLANNLTLQEQTVRKNVDLSLQNMNANGLNSSGFKPLDNLIDNVKNALQDPSVGQMLSQNTTIQNELGSLLAVKNASGTTVFDKLSSAGIIGKNDSPQQIQQKINTMMTEAGNFSSALTNTNADLWKQIDPLETDPSNPNRANNNQTTQTNTGVISTGKTANGLSYTVNNAGVILSGKTASGLSYTVTQ